MPVARSDSNIWLANGSVKKSFEEKSLYICSNTNYDLLTYRDMTYFQDNLKTFVKLICAHLVLLVSLHVHSPITGVQPEWICATDSAGEAF